MARKSRENPEIRRFILENVEAHPGAIASVTAARFQTTRVTTNRYLRKLVSEGLLEATGATKARFYRLREVTEKTFALAVTKDLQEDAVWRDMIAPQFKNIPKNITDICQYGVTEMVNNVIDHSESSECYIKLLISPVRIRLIVSDHGVGIFEKIRKDCGLQDPRHAILELSKGKLTTDPEKHTGEGIFFTSRMFERFCIASGELYYSREMKEDDDWLFESDRSDKPIDGTYVRMEISVNASYTDQEIFKKYENDENAFVRTHVPVRLARYGNEQLVSRSQARRVLSRFERFTEVILDFKDVPQIGQAFADEIFRVYENEHPEIAILAIRTTPQVQQMIQHVRANKTALISGLSSPPGSAP